MIDWPNYKAKQNFGLIRPILIPNLILRENESAFIRNYLLLYVH